MAHPKLVELRNEIEDDEEFKAVVAYLDSATQLALQGLLARPEDTRAFCSPTAQERAEEALEHGLALTRLRFYL